MKTAFSNGGIPAKQRVFIHSTQAPEIFMFDKEMNCVPTAQVALLLKNCAFALPANGVKVTFKINTNPVK